MADRKRRLQAKSLASKFNKSARKNDGDTFKTPDRPSYSQEPSSSEEDFKPSSTESTPLNNLRVNTENYHKIEGHIKRLSPVLKSREIVKGFLLGLTKKLDNNEKPPHPRINTDPPGLPNGIQYLQGFSELYKSKAESYLRRLAISIATQYHDMISAFTTEIDALTKEALSELNEIDDTVEKKKAIELFNVKVNSTIRKSSQVSRSFSKPNRNK